MVAIDDTPPFTVTQAQIRKEYERRLDARRREADAEWDKVKRLGTARLIAFGLFVLMAWAVTERHALSGYWLWLPILGFVVLVVKHRHAKDAWERALRAIVFYEDGLHRIDDTWVGRGIAGDRFADVNHPYTSDLDVFGPASLFELLCLARTSLGEERLADWLRNGADVSTICDRQAAVNELRHAYDLREDMAVLSSERSIVDAPALCAWGERPVTLRSKTVRVIAAILGAVTFGALIYWAATYDARAFFLLLAIEQLFASFWRAPMWEVIKGIDRPRRDLRRLARFVARLERETFAAPLLVRLRGNLDGAVEGLSAGGPGLAPSRRLYRLISTMEYAESWRNLFFSPFAVVLLWALQFAFVIEEWRARDGARLRIWLDTVAEVEALLSLSAFACEHPMDVFPAIVERGPCFEGQGLAHPLIPLARAIRNDVVLNGGQQILLVSGSNMAGKSSLLRTVGVNAVLALAGATVRGFALSISRLRVGACMRLQDSLQQGISHFYAEIKRLRQIVDMADGGSEGKLPLLFLFDEILHGTNSYDRKIGADAVVRTLVERGAIGLVTTHDLALTHIVDALSPRAINVHFQDELVDGKMTFDYTLHAGVVEKSNAIALMRAVGLDV